MGHGEADGLGGKVGSIGLHHGLRYVQQGVAQVYKNPRNPRS